MEFGQLLHSSPCSIITEILIKIRSIIKSSFSSWDNFGISFLNIQFELFFSFNSLFGIYKLLCELLVLLLVVVVRVVVSFLLLLVIHGGLRDDIGHLSTLFELGEKEFRSRFKGSYGGCLGERLVERLDHN